MARATNMVRSRGDGLAEVVSPNAWMKLAEIKLTLKQRPGLKVNSG